MENGYSENHLMYIFLDNMHQGGKYTALIASHQEELRIEESFKFQKYLPISYLQTDYLYLYNSSCSDRKNERANIVQVK